MTSVPHSAPALADTQKNFCFELRHPPGLGIYVHVPFCLKKCTYCDFYSVTGHGGVFDRYVAAVRAQIRRTGQERWNEDYTPETIFFGGGTPTVLSSDQLIELLHHCERQFSCRADQLETSIEVNPATVTSHDFMQLRRAGFNRVSIGVQTLDQRELAAIGRLHSAAEAEYTVSLARKAGFANLSLDLMYGLPGQDLASWQQTLERALALDPEHLSIYELTLARGTPLNDQVAQGQLRLPDEDEVLAMLDHTLILTTETGLHRYEISNYARPGYECSHNINYWQNGSYLGFGPAAVSCLSGRRFSAVADVEQFCSSIKARRSVWGEEEELDRETRFRETVIMGLRMLKGVSLSDLEQRFSINPVEYYGTILARLQQQKLIVLDHDRIFLSAQGLLLANRVMAELV